MAAQGLARKERLRGSRRIDEIFARGRIGKSRLVLVRTLENELGFSRIAVIAGRKAGKACVRNRLRRRLRAAFRTHKQELPCNLDLVLIARKGLLEADWPRVEADLVKAVKHAAMND